MTDEKKWKIGDDLMSFGQIIVTELQLYLLVSCNIASRNISKYIL